MNVRPVEERDIAALIALFRATYGEDYAVREVYEPEAIKRAIYSDNIYWLVAEQDGELLGSGALVLGLGDHNDQIGEIGRLVVAPGGRSKGLARALVDALIAASGERVEFAFAESRTVHPFSQKMADATAMVPLGFMPMAYQMHTRESFVFNGRLFGNGAALRSPGRARLIGAVRPLAELSLRNLKLEEPIAVERDVRAYTADPALAIEPLDHASHARLLRLEHGRVTEPEVFGAFHVDQGLSQLRARSLHYFVASAAGSTVGAIGYTLEAHDRSLRIVELIGAAAETKGALLRWVIDRAELIHRARIVQCDVSAECPRLQQTLLELGFLPAAYIPGMVFHDTRRWDVVRFLKLSPPWEPGPLALIDSSREYYDLVGPAFEQGLAARERAQLWRAAMLAQGYSPSEIELLTYGSAEAPHEGKVQLDPESLYFVAAGAALRDGEAIAVGRCLNIGALWGRGDALELRAHPECILRVLGREAVRRLCTEHPHLALKVAADRDHARAGGPIHPLD